ncbi:MAG: PEP-CTERM sorting domain-containing protein [Verrucomicrobiales bacterium]
MKKPISQIASSLFLLSLAAQGASAQGVYGVDSGVTSLSLDATAVAGLGYTVTGSSGTVSAQGGHQFGFDILSELSDFIFTIEEDTSATVQGGILSHLGWIELDNDGDPGTGIITLGNFEIGVDLARASDTVSGAFIRDTLGTNSIVFDIKPLSPTEINPVSDGGTFTLQSSDLLISPELYALLGSPDGIAAGDFLGSIRIDANTSRVDAVPEPSTGLLAILGGAVIFLRRRR